MVCASRVGAHMIQAHTLMVDESHFCSWLQWKRENAKQQPAASVSAAGSPPPAPPAPPPAAAAASDGSDGGTAAADNVETPAMPEGLSKVEQMKVSISDHPLHGLRE